LANPGFEEASDPHGKQPTYWIAIPRSTPTEPEARCARDTNVKLNGNASLSVSKPDVKHPVAEAGFMQNVVTLPADQVVYLSGHLKTEDVQGGVSLKLRLVDDKGQLVRECST